MPQNKVCIWLQKWDKTRQDLKFAQIKAVKDAFSKSTAAC